MFVPRYFVRFEFKVIRKITNLPFYRGKHLNTMFRVLFDPYLPKGKGLANFKIRTIPTQNGDSTMLPGENVSVILSFPPASKDNVSEIIESLSNRKFDMYDFPSNSHFHPQLSVNFIQAVCCRCKKIWTDKCQPLEEDDLRVKVNKLSRLREFTLHFYTPLRLKRLERNEDDYTFFNEDYFTVDNFLTALAGSENIQKHSLQIIDKYFHWIECKYKLDQYGETRQTIGGLCGFVRFSGKMNIDLAKALVYGQYTGIGKNRTFGFGYYSITELMMKRGEVNYPNKFFENFKTPF
ncbi:MAG: CRISPR system precrRNA processing endoribonuclease RAMP protein Cas6 [Candidatus Cloacimonetes bacterium]|nr:CRISPR system precrRNA processing endoribonuclease RAMP protein Cas6 [Candidatus Cloacimonadota bacterium]